ncbi:hypothetical protein GCM10023201_38480 [Actinomycetospora corticicola]|uniref:Uncharacterized protein n=1 Tax=Actinomycetospora corticicola TaxID=663602 RepID=A0A7Y9J799_9PSEU|nr:hypothetical protein [Actinomycetospora corticicola]NYD38048.1 hypothetical protein [Actinomycetospora corticicola]
MTRLAAAVAATADQLRAANHATVRGAITPTETYDVVGNLDDLAHRLPQLLDFLVRSLRRADGTEHFDDRGTDSGQALRLARGHLDDARHRAAELAAHLTHAHNELGHLGQLRPED